MRLQVSKLDEGIYFGKLVKADGIKLNGKEVAMLVFEVSHRDANGAWQPLSQLEKADVLFFLTQAAWEINVEKMLQLGFNRDFKNMQFNVELSNEGIELFAAVSDKGYNQLSIPSIESMKEPVLLTEAELDVVTARLKTAQAATTAPAAPAAPTAPASPANPAGTSPPSPPPKDDSGSDSIPF